MKATDALVKSPRTESRGMVVDGLRLTMPAAISHETLLTIFEVSRGSEPIGMPPMAC